MTPRKRHLRLGPEGLAATAEAERPAQPDARPSPEETGVYRCDACGNTTRFLGIDRDGWPGDDAEEDDRVTLRQSFTVIYEDSGFVDIHYEAHEGGGYGAEIGSYTRIDCGECGAVIWEEAPRPAPAYLDAAARRLILRALDELENYYQDDLDNDNCTAEEHAEGAAELARVRALIGGEG